MEKEVAICRICYSDNNPFTGDRDLISPCNCRGSVKYVHNTCLKFWRFKGDFFTEIKTCEQCKAAYSITGEKIPHKYLIMLLTGVLILCIYGLCTLFFSSIFRAFLIIFEDVLLDSRSGPMNTVVVIPDLTYYLTCAMVFITLCKLLLKPALFTVFNYIFTFWRILQFGFLIDKGLFAIFSIFFLAEMYWSLYHKMDRICFLVRNGSKWAQ